MGESAYPPPPYDTKTSLSNPGFCPYAYAERQANREPGGGMPSAAYSLPCKGCHLTVGSIIPVSYKYGWKDAVDPSLNFRWESHIQGVGEFLGCWICWENEQKWAGAMRPQDWYTHMRNHFRNDRYQPCRSEKGIMQRRRNCANDKCGRIHS